MKLISIVGPTAIGKTRLAIELANQLQTEIISSDSRQLYQEMTIGTAKPTKEELEQAPHHFVNHISIQDHYSVGQFEREVLAKLQELFQKYETVIMVGGSPLYEKAVIEGLDVFPDIDSNIRKDLNQQLKNDGIQSLQTQLKELDPQYYEIVDIQNPHRLIRALEIAIGTGKPYSEFLNQKKEKRPFEIQRIGLQAPRETIYKRINERVDVMMQEGLLEEAKELYPYKELNALQTVGYQELFQYLDGEIDLDFAISEIKKNSRRFAKRQLTWYRKSEEIEWVDWDKTHDHPLLKNS